MFKFVKKCLQFIHFILNVLAFLILLSANEIFRLTQEQSVSQSFIGTYLLIKKRDMFLKVYLLICIP